MNCTLPLPKLSNQKHGNGKWKREIDILRSFMDEKERKGK